MRVKILNFYELGYSANKVISSNGASTGLTDYPAIENYINKYYLSAGWKISHFTADGNSFVFVLTI